jgi:hypothetical protein
VKHGIFLTSYLRILMFTRTNEREEREPIRISERKWVKQKSRDRKGERERERERER